MEQNKRERKKPEESSLSAPAWITTFTDIMSLLCTFFILILTFSTIEREKFEKARGSLQGALGVMGVPKKENISGVTSLVPFDRDVDERMKTPFPKRLEREMNEFRLLRNRDDRGLMIDAELIKDGVRLRLKGDALFDPGSAVIRRKECKKFLSQVGNILAEAQVEVVVEGHTDSHFQSTLAFPTSLDLSGARAAAVARFFLEEWVSEEDLKIAAFGKYKPVFPNTDPLNRAMNRRVDITLFQKEEEDG